MSREPLCLFINESAKPSAVHVLSPVPIHFRKELKAGLNRDVRLGVLERVPTNTSVTYCSRMVIATKPNGTPRP